jgi:RNA polymerase sigma-70 factor, ECF subfamily
MLPADPDQHLVALAQRGDMAAFDQLLGRYEQKTYNLAYRMMGNHADASDAAQNAMVRIYTRLKEFRGDALFSTWLYRIVTNSCLDDLRRRGRQRLTYNENPLSGDPGPLARHVVDSADLPHEVAERNETQRYVHNALGRLPDSYRTVIVLRDIQGYSYQEIAGILGASLGTIKSRLHRARQALKLLLLASGDMVEATVA